MMQDETAIRFVRVLVKMIDTVGVEQRGTAFEAVNHITFF